MQSVSRRVIRLSSCVCSRGRACSSEKHAQVAEVPGAHLPVRHTWQRLTSLLKVASVSNRQHRG